MNKLNLDQNKLNILNLSQQWKLGVIEEEDFKELNAWYLAVSGEVLGMPDSFTTEKLEMWLHRLFFKPSPSSNDPAVEELRKSIWNKD